MSSGVPGQHLGERVLDEIVGIDVEAADHRREPPQRLVLLPQPLDPLGIPPRFKSHSGPAPACAEALHSRHTRWTPGGDRM